MSDSEVSEDGTISPAEAGALERAVLQRLEAHFQQALRAAPREPWPVVITTTVRFKKPLVDTGGLR